MVFGFWSKKQSPPPAASASPGDSGSPARQLRTPSPSESASAQVPPAPSSPDRPPPSEPSRPEPPADPLDPTALHALLTTVPPKTLHAYTLAQLSTAPEPTLAALGAFFATLTPPPMRHCVRCHKDFTDVENTDRSCLVPHDDESAEVERVGRSRKVGAAEGPVYETLWGCCGKTVEGDGDQGPPDGWCYEGKHTTDAKRARFRADSTPTNDKLPSCYRMNCHGIRTANPRPTRAKRARPAPVERDEEDEEDEESEGEPDGGVDEIAQGVQELDSPKATKAEKSNTPQAKGKATANANANAGTKSRTKGKGKAQESGGEDVGAGGGDGGSPAVADTPPKPRARPRKRKPEDAADSAPAPEHEKGKKKTKGKKAEPEPDVEMEGPEEGAAAQKKRKAPPKVVVASRGAKTKARGGKEEVIPETEDERMDVDGEKTETEKQRAVDSKQKSKESKVTRKRRKIVATTGVA